MTEAKGLCASCGKESKGLPCGIMFGLDEIEHCTVYEKNVKKHEELVKKFTGKKDSKGKSEVKEG